MTTLLIKNLKILLVEDESLVMMVHKKMLEQLGFMPDIAETGYQALAMAENQYDLVFLDLGLPDIDGVQVSARLRGQVTAKKQPYIIALTAYAIDEVKERCLKSGIDDVIRKPLSRQTLESLILRADAFKQAS